MCIRNGWKFSNNGEMLLQSLDGRESIFSQLVIRPDIKNHSALILDGTVYADGLFGTISPDKEKIRNRDKALLLIVSDDSIHLPDHLYHDHRVKIDPVINEEGTLAATIICFLKNEELIFLIGEGESRKEIFFEYDKYQRFPVITDITVPELLDPATNQKTLIRKLLDIFSFNLRKKNPGFTGGVTRG